MRAGINIAKSRREEGQADGDCNAMVSVAVASVPMAWAAYQLNWIRQRHEFLAERQQRTTAPSSWRLPPWSLRIFGERSPDAFAIQKQDKAEAEALFPEASVYVLDIGGQERIRSGEEVHENAGSNDASHPLPGGGF